MPNAKNLGVGLLVTALIVGIVGKEAYTTGNWDKVASDFSGKFREIPFAGSFTANRCGGDKLGRSTKGAECQLDFDLEMQYHGKSYHIGNTGMSVDGVHIDHKSPTEGEVPEMKKTGPNTMQVGDFLEITFLNSRNVAARAMWGSINFGYIWNNPASNALANILYPPTPSPTPSPTYDCATWNNLQDDGTVACIGGAVQSAVVAGGLYAAPATAGLSFLASFAISTTINAVLSTTVTGVSSLDCVSLALNQLDESDYDHCPSSSSSWFSIPAGGYVNMGGGF